MSCIYSQWDQLVAQQTNKQTKRCNLLIHKWKWTKVVIHNGFIVFEQSSVLSKGAPIGKVDLVPKCHASGSHHRFVHENFGIGEMCSTISHDVGLTGSIRLIQKQKNLE